MIVKNSGIVDIGQNISVGQNGLGTLIIEDGGKISNAHAYIGSSAGSEGAVTVTGPNALWQSSRSVYVGREGTGSLLIENGGTVRNSYWTGGDRHAFIGNSETSDGTVTVTGTGSTWDNDRALFVGNAGSGTLTISEGGVVRVGSKLTVADKASSKGTVNIGAGEDDDPAAPGVIESTTINFGAGTGTLTFNHTDANYVFESNLTSTGSGTHAINHLAGTTTLTGNGSGFAGTTTVSGGTLIVGNTLGGSVDVGEYGTLIGHADSITGTIRNAGSVIIDQEEEGSFAGNIGGLDGDDGQMVKKGAGTLTLAGTSTLDWMVVAGGLVSTTDRFSGNLDLAEGATFTFHQDYSGSYAGTISGDGRILFTGGGVIELTGDASGPTDKVSEVTDSTLVVNGALGGSAVIGSGGRLSGDGTIGSGNGSMVTIGSGGTIAPGNSIGTLTVEGDFVFDPGSAYEVEVDPGGMDSDLIAITGTATLGGSVVHIGMAGNYAPTATYTILTAAGGVEGTFSGVSSPDFAFLDPILGYGDNDVTLTLQRNDIDFTEVARTGNQMATAASLNALTFGNALYDAVVQTDETTARAAFDQLSGEIHASVKTGLIEDSRHIRNAANDRLRAGLGAHGHNRGIAAWGTAFGSWGHSDGDGNAAKLDRSTAGFVAGLDGRIANTGRVGFLAGYSRSSFDVDDRRSSADADSYHLGLYGGTEWGALALRSGLAYSWHDLDTSRSVAFTGFADKLTADYGAGTFQAFGEVGYRVHGRMITVEPFANLAHVALRSDAFTEQGDTAALTGNGRSTGVTLSVLGLRAEAELAFGTTTATLRGMAGWQHAFGDTVPLSTHAFAGSDTFTIAGAPIAEDLAVIEAGLDLDLAPDATLGVHYQGRFGADARDNGFNARLSVRF